MKSPELNDKTPQGFSIDKILEFVKKNIRYIAGGALLLALILVLANFTGSNSGGSGEGTEAVGEAGLAAEKYQVDAIPELNELIQNYYSAYAAGKTKKIRNYASPVTKNERSFIKMFSENVDGYENIKCYTKEGLEKGSYLVSVYLEIKFKDVDTLAPGLDFFYVSTDEDGGLYINNLYSQFNLQNKEKELDNEIKTRIDRFEQEEDVVKLREDVQKKYEDALASDEKLRTMIDITIADAYAAWAKEIAEAGNGEEPETETQQQEEPETETQTNTEQPLDESEIVYALDTLNIRASASADGQLVDTVPAGTALTRTGTTSDGWSRLEYNGQEVYVKSEFVSTEAPAKQEPQENNDAPGVAEGTKITLSNTVNVRASMGEDAQKIGTAFTGETVTVIMSYAEGWTKVEWNGQTGFVKTEFLK